MLNFYFPFFKKMAENNMRKRSRFSVNNTNAGPLERQRTISWGPYSHSSSFINPYYPQQNSIINLPPAESVLINELGGNESIQNNQAGNCDTSLSAGLGGCQKVIEDGFYDNNGYFNFTEEGSFVQLLAYRFRRTNTNPNTQQSVECISCYIDMGTLKLNIENKDIKTEVIIKQLQEEISFALTGSQSISWPRFCMWNSVTAPSLTRKSYACSPWLPQANPVDDSMLNNAFALFFQTTIPPLVLVKLTGMRQLTITLNPDYVSYCNTNYPPYGSSNWLFQLLTPRTDGLLNISSSTGNLTRPPLPSEYLNVGLLDGKHGWFQRNPYTFGFGFRKYVESGRSYFCDIYEYNNWDKSNFLSTIGSDFVINQPTIITYDPTRPYYDMNQFAKTRFLQPLVVANMPCSMSASRYYLLTSSYISSKQVRPFISTTTSSGPTDTIGIMWDNVINGNIPRDISGSLGEDTGNMSFFIKEINPMFNNDRFNLIIYDEWYTRSLSGGGYISNRTLQAVNNNTANLKDQAIYNAIYIPLYSTTTPPTNQNGTIIEPTWSGIPYDLYSPYAPSWMKFDSDSHGNGYNVQFDVRRYCRNRCLVSFQYKNSSEPVVDRTPTSSLSTFKPYNIIVQNLWGTSNIEDGEEKPSDKKVHFMRLITP